MKSPTHAQDKRTVDQDGRLRVPGCRISKANVCPYYGREIPGFDTLGLDPDRVYMMYRDPEALRAGAASFEGVPLLSAHVPVTADSHAPEITVGTITNPRFEYPYLVADLVVWTDEAKELIDTERQRELSSAYRYEPDMRPGTSPEGLRYDGVMRMIMGNHLALVAEGRAGPDVMVADEAPQAMKFPKFAALLAKLFPTPPTAETLVALDSALAEEIEAMDELDDEKKKAACDEYAKELGKDAAELTDEEKSEAYARAAKDGMPPVKPAQDSAPAVALDEAAITAKAREGYILATDAKTAQDAAVAAARAEGAAAARAEAGALFAAREAVAEKCGVVALDSAEAVYRFALDKLSIPHKDVPAVALAALYAGVAARPAAPVTPEAPFNARDVLPGLKLITRG